MKYRVILADPPWAYNNRHATRSDNPGKKSKFGIGVASRYSAGVLDADTIGGLGEYLAPVCAPDALCFMWATCPCLDEGIRVLQAWGFEYVTIAFFWAKTYPSGQTFRGPGRYVPANMEPVLLGRRSGAKCWHPATGWKPEQEVRCPHPRDAAGKIIHSRKPEDVHERLEIWLGSYIGPYGFLELFATQPRPGWTCLGHAITGTDIRDDLRRLA